MGFKKMSWLQQVLYVLVYKLGEFERNRWKIILNSEPAFNKDNTDSLGSGLADHRKGEFVYVPY